MKILTIFVLGGMLKTFELWVREAADYYKYSLMGLLNCNLENCCAKSKVNYKA